VTQRNSAAPPQPSTRPRRHRDRSTWLLLVEKPRGEDRDPRPAIFVYRLARVCLASITIRGLGPGDAALLTRQAWVLLDTVRVLYLRTAVHPTVAGLPSHLELRSFDALYESAGAFGEIYNRIAADL